MTGIYMSKRFSKKAIEFNVRVIGITDYFTIDGYKRILNDYLNDESKLGKLFHVDEIEKVKRITIFQI